jgi:hypothetical protein
MPFQKGYRVKFEQATLILSEGKLTVYPEEGEAFVPTLEKRITMDLGINVNGFGTYLYEITQFVDAIEQGWARSWRAKGWRKADKSPALNPDLWEKLLNLLDTHEVELVWVKGHDGHPYNERCDKLATAFADSFPEPVDDEPPFDVNG